MKNEELIEAKRIFIATTANGMREMTENRYLQALEEFMEWQAKNLHKPLVSSQVCDHDYQRVYRDQESMFVCTKCHKRQGYKQTCY